MTANPLYNPLGLPELHCRKLTDHSPHTTADTLSWCPGGPWAAPGNTSMPPSKTI